MPQGAHPVPDEISLLALGTVILRSRWRILRWMFVGAGLASLLVFSRPPRYVATVSFLPQGSEPSRSELADLAGQFGFSLPNANQSFSPVFYTELLQSRAILGAVIRDTLSVDEMEGQRISFLDLFGVDGAGGRGREEDGIRRLRKTIQVSVVRTTEIVEFKVVTRWPSVSLAIATALMDGVNEFNRRTAQGQAGAERAFVEERLELAGIELREAEDRLQQFLSTNRQISNSPELQFQHDRLQRDVMLHQQLFTSLSQTYEEVRIREVRDTPQITLIDGPSLPADPEPRTAIPVFVLGAVLGGVVGALSAVSSGRLALRRNAGDEEVEEFFATIGELRTELSGLVHRKEKVSESD